VRGGVVGTRYLSPSKIGGEYVYAVTASSLRQISDEGDAIEADVLAQQFQVDGAISIRFQEEAPPVPALRHMVRYVNGNHTIESSHARKRYQELVGHTAGLRGEKAFMIRR
jgi:hypothetical protein